jgi:hypothetical protein
MPGRGAAPSVTGMPNGVDGAMPRPPVRLHGCVRGGRWLMPWLAVLLVSTSLAYALNRAITGAWVTFDARAELSVTPADGDAARELGLACISRVTAYTSSMLDAVHRCTTLASDINAR